MQTAAEPSKRVKLLDEAKTAGATAEGKKNDGSIDDENEACEESAERRKIPCPMFACKAIVAHLPRHMRTVHHWTKEAASKVLSKFNIRKPKNEKKAKENNYHSRRRCPLADCHSIVQRLPAHLQQVHKLDKMSKEYCDAMENATVVPDVRHLQIRWQEERFKTKKWEGGPKSQTNIAEEYHTHQKEVSEDDELRWDDSSSSRSDNDCDDIENDVTVEDIPTATMPALLAEFEDWFLSPDGGKRDEKTVKQHSSQLFSLLKVIDDEEDMQSLLDVKLVRQVFLKSHVEKKRYEAGTIKSYLMSLRHFYTFLVSDRPENFNFDVEEVNAAREKVKLWSASYKRESSERKWKKLEEDMMNRLTPGNIRSFEKSQTVREAVKIIGKHSDTSQTTVVTQQSYTLVRDFLFTQIFIDNANRPGVLAGMTIDEYKRMTKQDDSYIITVLKHKTSHVHGPARIVLSSKLKSWLSVFVEVMRPQIASATCGNVFLTWSAKGMISGHITKAVQSVFKKSGINVKVTSTSFRKAAVTAVHSGKPTFSGKLARHMAHSETTAKKYYLLTEKTKESVETSKELGELMRCDGEEQQDSDKKGDSETRDKEDTAGETECATNQKGEWNDSDFEKVRTIFGKDITAKTITMERVREGIESSEELYGMSPRRIYDKIRKTINKESASLQNILELPQTCESLEDKLQRFEECSETVNEELSTSIIQPSERNSNFTDEEMNSLQKIFKDMITEDKKICRIEIEKRLSTNKDGGKILKKLSVVKVVNRVKYERRKHRQQPK